jgi:hypothetical protein
MYEREREREIEIERERERRKIPDIIALKQFTTLKNLYIFIFSFYKPFKRLISS